MSAAPIQTQPRECALTAGMNVYEFWLERNTGFPKEIALLSLASG